MSNFDTPSLNPYEVTLTQGTASELANLGEGILNKYMAINQRMRSIEKRSGGNIIMDMAYYPELYDNVAWQEMKEINPYDYTFKRKSKEDANYVFSQVLSKNDMNDLLAIVARLRSLGLNYYNHGSGIISSGGINIKSPADAISRTMERIASLTNNQSPPFR